MTDRPVTAVPRGAAGTPAPLSARLEPDAIGVAQDTIIGLGDVGPALSVGLTLAGLAAAAAYAWGAYDSHMPGADAGYHQLSQTAGS
jgi:hypothetical protein